MDKLVPQSANSGGLKTCQDTVWNEGYPCMVRYLTETTYSDGSVRQASTLALFVEGSLCKVSLNDKDSCASLYRTGPSFKDALDSIEEALEGGTSADWRPWKKTFKK